MCPGLHGVGLLDFWSRHPPKEPCPCPKRYPEEFRRKVLDLVAAGRPVAQIAADLQISDQTIYDWRRQEQSAKPDSPTRSRPCTPPRVAPTVRAWSTLS